MLENFFLGILLLSCCRICAQNSPSQFELLPIGGKDEVEQVLQTQMTLPKMLLTSSFDVEVTANFDLDSAGHAKNLNYRAGLNNALRTETTRLLRFMTFRKTQNEAFETYPYSFTYHISTERYSRFMKQHNKFTIKKNLPADSSFIVYSKAERAPEYYKNGEEGLNDYILSEIEYPKLAVEKSVEGTVVVEFIVETNGYVTGVALKQGLGAGCSEEALRLIRSTRWQPAILNNKLVRYRTTYPITFSLRNTTRDASSTIGQ